MKYYIILFLVFVFYVCDFFLRVSPNLADSKQVNSLAPLSEKVAIDKPVTTHTNKALFGKVSEAPLKEQNIEPVKREDVFEFNGEQVQLLALGVNTDKNAFALFSPITKTTTKEIDRFIKVYEGEKHFGAQVVSINMHSIALMTENKKQVFLKVFENKEIKK